MTNDKAREFFSTYFEGSLDAGLRQALEQKLKSDAVLASDYAAFSETMNELDSMRFEEIEVPLYLSDRIATRLEAVQEKKVVPVFSWLRLVQGGAIAAVVVVAGVLAYQGFDRANTDQSNMMGSVAPMANVDTDQFRFNYADGKVTVNYKPSAPRTIVVSSGTTGKELNRFHLDRQELSSPLSNDLTGTALFDIKVLGDDEHAMVAVPGTSSARQASGNGTVKDLSAALADFYRTPVLLQADRMETPVSWNFKSSEPRTEATDVLRDLGYSVDLRPSGMIVIMDR